MSVCHGCAYVCAHICVCVRVCVCEGGVGVEGALNSSTSYKKIIIFTDIHLLTADFQLAINGIKSLCVC